MKPKFTDKFVIEVRKKYLTGKYSFRTLAKELNVEHHNVQRMIRRYNNVDELKEEARAFAKTRKYLKLGKPKRNSLSHIQKDGDLIGVMSITNSAGSSYDVFYNLEDEELIKKHSWYIPPSCKHKYPRTNINKKVCMLHRVLMGFPENKVVDHIDENPLNNLRENLRICTHSENQRNRGTPKSNSTGYIGISYINGRTCLSHYQASVTISGATHYIGSYYTALLAAVAYDDYIKKIKDEYSTLNFPKGLSREQKIQLEKDEKKFLEISQQRKEKSLKERKQNNLKKDHELFKKMENVILEENPRSVKHMCDIYVEKMNITKPTAGYLSKKVWKFYYKNLINKNNHPILYKLAHEGKLPPKQIKCGSCEEVLQVNNNNFYMRNGRPYPSTCKKCISVRNKLRYREKKKLQK